MHKGALLVVGVLFTWPQDVHADWFPLVEPRTCLAGSWGAPKAEWRIQFGVYNHAGAIARSLQISGVGAEVYLAAWLARGQLEPEVVVSRERFKSRQDARRYLLTIQDQVPSAFVRRFTRYTPHQR